jgi:putative hydrolase of the HAD superfamily
MYSMPLHARPQTLLIDADDTLWENNIYFERATAGFVELVNHQHYSPEQVRQILIEVERESVMTHGYGLHSFAHSLTQTLEKLAVQPVTPELHARISALTHAIADHPVEILPGVPETLAYLSARHHLILMTKGAFAEQSGKIERSGLKEHFSAVEIVAEKDNPTYRTIVDKYQLSPDSTWMAGNSPKSDINPALAIGLNAIFVPHRDTWILEHEHVAEPTPPRRLLIVERFSQLQEHF